MDQILNNLIAELKRGTLILFVLSALTEHQYGYSLLSQLESQNISIEAGTLYPLLRRLEEQGLLESTWDTTDSRPRKYYKINQDGKHILDKLKKEWLDIQNQMNTLFKENNSYE